MILAEARAYVGKMCAISWQDREGVTRETTSRVHDATYVPLYGGYLITDCDDIRLDRITSVYLVGEIQEPAAGAAPVTSERLAA
ncbi:MAG TPA: hypothetical protein VGS41_01500 [Chthonomonadales bacterium]|nr:hypothetical protein [Chthonomonadales bacterium]